MGVTRVVHVRDNVPEAVYIGRAMPAQRLSGSLFANPFRIGPDGDRAEVMARYRAEMGVLCRVSPDHFDALTELVGKPLACWCRHEGEARTAATVCHGDVLIDLLRDLGLEPADARAGRPLATIHYLHDDVRRPGRAKDQAAVSEVMPRRAAR